MKGNENRVLDTRRTHALHFQSRQRQTPLALSLLERYSHISNTSFTSYSPTMVANTFQAPSPATLHARSQRWVWIIWICYILATLVQIFNLATSFPKLWRYLVMASWGWLTRWEHNESRKFGWPCCVCCAGWNYVEIESVPYLAPCDLDAESLRNLFDTTDVICAEHSVQAYCLTWTSKLELSMLLH